MNMNMNMKELRKLLKDNGVCFYSYWNKDKLEDLARINKLTSEEKPEPKEEPKTEEPKAEEAKTEEAKVEEVKTSKRPDYKRMRRIRNEPISVKFIDVKTKEEKVFPSIYKGAQFINKCPQTVAHYGRRKGIWDKKYQIIIE